MPQLDILIIESEDNLRKSISNMLEKSNFIVRTSKNSTGALNEINKKLPAAIILNIWLENSDLDGINILEITKKRYPNLPVIIISNNATITSAVRAIKMGAFDYIEKPFTEDKLLIVLKRAYENSTLQKEITELKSHVTTTNRIIGSSTITQKIISDIQKISNTSSRVMIIGDIGSGKELVARVIHNNSDKSNGNFIKYNPTGKNAQEIEQDLFGTTNNKSRDSSLLYYNGYQSTILEKANNGTLYIDEVINLPLTTQYKLLNFIYNPFIISNGKKITINTRIITSSSIDMKKNIELGGFIEDLYNRLNIITIELPSLLERKDDIPELVEYFVNYFSKSTGINKREFTNDAILSLQSYKWPGNIRQLKNIIEWTMIMNRGPESEKISYKMLPPEILNNKLDIAQPMNNANIMAMQLKEARELFEKEYLSAQMNRFNNNISKTSSFIGMERSALHRKLKILEVTQPYNNKIKENIKEKILA